MNSDLLCAICGGACSLLDPVDFNKSCEDTNGNLLGSSGFPIYYALCGKCGFCFAPQIASWTLEEFEERIYNDQYILVDPDYIETRPRTVAAKLIALFGDRIHAVKHLDYGGGNGLLARILTESNWQSLSYDPFADRNVAVEKIGKFDLITAFEVFEHVPHVRQLMSNLRSLLSPNGLILFTTILSDGNIHPDQKINWWYASPRNGHISLFSRNSLLTLAKNNGFNFGSLTTNTHIFWTNMQPWAAHVIRMAK